MTVLWPAADACGVRFVDSVAVLPERVEEFLRRCIHSVEELEIFLLLRASADAWTCDAVNRELKTSLHSVTARMEELRAHGLLERIVRDGQVGYRYDPPPNGQTSAAIDELAVLYATRRVAVISAIFGDST